MGGLSSALAPIIQAGSAISSVAGLAKPFYADSVDRQQQKESNVLALQQAQASANIQKENNRIAALNEENSRKLALKRAVAKQRAEYGGNGLSSEGGSAEAVLLGLFNESEKERQLREQSTALKDAAIDQSLGNIQQKNLLAQAQASQQDTINRLTDLL